MNITSVPAFGHKKMNYPVVPMPPDTPYLARLKNRQPDLYKKQKALQQKDAQRQANRKVIAERLGYLQERLSRQRALDRQFGQNRPANTRKKTELFPVFKLSKIPGMGSLAKAASVISLWFGVSQ